MARMTVTQLRDIVENDIGTMGAKVDMLHSTILELRDRVDFLDSELAKVRGQSPVPPVERTTEKQPGVDVSRREFAPNEIREAMATLRALRNPKLKLTMRDGMHVIV